MTINGLLYSQIGYDYSDPMRAIYRSSDPLMLSDKDYFVIESTNNHEEIMRKNIEKFGEKWGHFFWIMDFTGLDIGEYQLKLFLNDGTLIDNGIFEVDVNLLFNKTIVDVGILQFEERARRSRNGIGWKDCGSEFREANSHATAIIGLCDLHNKAFEYLKVSEAKRLMDQIIVGCDYLMILADKAERLSYEPGSLVHEIPNGMDVLPRDIAQSIIALTKASRNLADTRPDKSDQYLDQAITSFELFLSGDLKPFGMRGFSHINQGAPIGYIKPDEFSTRDLLLFLWGATELLISGKIEYEAAAANLCDMILSRQVREDEAETEGGYYGHFFAFSDRVYTEKANTHHHFGHDTGGTFPFYVIPVIELINKLYDHEHVDRWKKMVRDFAYGFFKPACESNPFYLIPEGYFKGQGLLNFCGPWHGINTSIAYGATLACALESFTGDIGFRNIAVGNLQWIAGLNLGLSSNSFQTSVWKEKIPEGMALPYSQIHGIGKRNVGVWTDIKGTICNGFSANPQFKIEVEPSIENDYPTHYTDEDWIPHSGGFVSGQAYLIINRFFDKFR